MNVKFNAQLGTHAREMPYCDFKVVKRIVATSRWKEAMLAEMTNAMIEYGIKPSGRYFDNSRVAFLANNSKRRDFRELNAQHGLTHKGSLIGYRVDHAARRQ